MQLQLWDKEANRLQKALDNAYDPMISEGTGGEYTLTFKYPVNESEFSWISRRKIVRVVDTSITTWTDTASNLSGSKINVSSTDGLDLGDYLIVFDRDDSIRHRVTSDVSADSNAIIQIEDDSDLSGSEYLYISDEDNSETIYATDISSNEITADLAHSYSAGASVSTPARSFIARALAFTDTYILLSTEPFNPTGRVHKVNLRTFRINKPPAIHREESGLTYADISCVHIGYDLNDEYYLIDGRGDISYSVSGSGLVKRESISMTSLLTNILVENEFNVGMVKSFEYTEGKATISKGSKSVEGKNVDWSNISSGSYIYLEGDSSEYIVDYIDTTTTLRLTSNASSSLTKANYMILSKSDYDGSDYRANATVNSNTVTFSSSLGFTVPSGTLVKYDDKVYTVAQKVTSNELRLTEDTGLPSTTKEVLLTSDSRSISFSTPTTIRGILSEMNNIWTDSNQSIYFSVNEDKTVDIIRKPIPDPRNPTCNLTIEYKYNLTGLTRDHLETEYGNRIFPTGSGSEWINAESGVKTVVSEDDKFNSQHKFHLDNSEYDLGWQFDDLSSRTNPIAVHFNPFRFGDPLQFLRSKWEFNIENAAIKEITVDLTSYNYVMLIYGKRGSTVQDQGQGIIDTTDNKITDTSKSWTTDAWIDYVLCIYDTSDGSFGTIIEQDYISDNTSTELYFYPTTSIADGVTRDYRIYNRIYTNYTNEARDLVENDLPLWDLDNDGIVEQDVRMLWGCDKKYKKLVGLLNPNVGGEIEVDWTYWDGSSWQPITFVHQEIDTFSDVDIDIEGEGTYENILRIPTDWEKKTLTDVNSNSYNRYWLRATLTTRTTDPTTCNDGHRYWFGEPRDGDLVGGYLEVNSQVRSIISNSVSEDRGTGKITLTLDISREFDYVPNTGDTVVASGMRANSYIRGFGHKVLKPSYYEQSYIKFEDEPLPNMRIEYDTLSGTFVETERIREASSLSPVSYDDGDGYIYKDLTGYHGDTNAGIMSIHSSGGTWDVGNYLKGQESSATATITSVSGLSPTTGIYRGGLLSVTKGPNKGQVYNIAHSYVEELTAAGNLCIQLEKPLSSFGDPEQTEVEIIGPPQVVEQFNSIDDKPASNQIDLTTSLVVDSDAFNGGILIITSGDTSGDVYEITDTGLGAEVDQTDSGVANYNASANRYRINFASSNLTPDAHIDKYFVFDSGTYAGERYMITDNGSNCVDIAIPLAGGSETNLNWHIEGTLFRLFLGSNLDASFDYTTDSCMIVKPHNLECTIAEGLEFKSNNPNLKNGPMYTDEVILLLKEYGQLTVGKHHSRRSIIVRGGTDYVLIDPGEESKYQKHERVYIGAKDISSESLLNLRRGDQVQGQVAVIDSITSSYTTNAGTYSKLTFSSNLDIIPQPGDHLECITVADMDDIRYNKDKVISLHYSAGSVRDPKELMDKGEKFLGESIRQLPSYSVDFNEYTLARYGDYSLGDTVRVLDYGLDIDRDDLRIIKRSYSPYKPQLPTIDIGKLMPTQVRKEAEVTQERIDELEALVHGPKSPRKCVWYDNGCTAPNPPNLFCNTVESNYDGKYTREKIPLNKTFCQNYTPGYAKDLGVDNAIVTAQHESEVNVSGNSVETVEHTTSFTLDKRSKAIETKAVDASSGSEISLLNVEVEIIRYSDDKPKPLEDNTGCSIKVTNNTSNAVEVSYMLLAVGSQR